MPAAGVAREHHAGNRRPHLARGRRHRRVRSDGDTRRPALPGAHRRHRQLVGPQAAPAAASRRSGLGGRCAVRRVLHRLGQRRTRRSRTKRPGSAGPVAPATTTRSAARTRAQSRSSTRAATYAAGSVGSDDTETQPPCDTPSLMFDVKGSEAGLPLIFQIPGLSDVDAINAHARVQLKLVEVQEGMLPVAVPDLRFTYVFATFVNEATGASLGTVELQRSGTSGNDQLWSHQTESQSRSTLRTSASGSASSAAPIRTPPAASSTQSATTSTRRTASSTSAAGARRRPGGSQRVAPARILSPGRVLRDRGLQRGHPGRGRPRLNHPLTGTGVTAKVWASVDGSWHVPAHPGRHDRPRHLDRRQRTAFRGRRALIRSRSTGAGSRPRAPGTA